MSDKHDILEEYLQMRQSNAAREQADMSLLRQLRDELLEAKQTIREQEETIRQLRQTISEMKAARPVNIGTMNGTYIESIQNAELCQPSSMSSTGRISNTSTPTLSTNITRLPSK